MVVFLYPYVLLPILFVASYAAGRVFGTVFSARLFQITGFTSLLIPFFAVLATLLALLGSLAIVALYEHFTAPSAVFTAIASFGIIYSILRSLLPEC